MATFSGVADGNYGFTKTGSGTLVFSGSSTYAGGTTLAAGTLQLGNISALGSATGSLTVNGGTLDLHGFSPAVAMLGGSGGTITNGTGSATLTTNFTGASACADVISGPVGLVKQGSGTLTLSGTNTYSGGTTISTGVLQVGNILALGSGLVTVSGGFLDLNGQNLSTGSLAGEAAGTITNNSLTTTGVLVVNQGTGGTFSGAIIDGTAFPTALVKNGAGQLTLSGSDSYSGGTTVNTGTLLVSGNTNSSNGTASVNNSSTLQVSGTFGSQKLSIYNGAILAGNGTIVLGSGGLYFGSTAAMTFNGAFTGTGGIEVGTALTLSGANTFSGGVQIDGTATLKAGAAGAIPSGAGKGLVNFLSSGVLDVNGTAITINGLTGTGQVYNGVSNTATLTVGAGDANSTFNGVLTNHGTSGSGILALTKIGTGAFTLGNANSFTGTLTISTGTLVIGTGGSTGSIVATTVTDNASLAFNRSDTCAYGTVVSGTGNLTQLGPGVLLLTATNTYSGGTTLAAGTLQVGNTVALGSATGSLTVNGGALDLGGFSPAVGPLGGSGGTITSSTGSATLTTNVAGSSTYTGAISVALGLVKQGTGTLTLSGWNTYGGNTLVATGTLAPLRGDPGQRLGDRRYGRQRHDCRHRPTVRRQPVRGIRGDGRLDADRRDKHRLQPSLSRLLLRCQRNLQP